ncbi:hypothetical protein Ple7327_3601 [Pleurocapsa sp. PCC 7327]|nr:hypothetical protein [Pleurocapsa sp. PCC 7327]AFY78800.1 hypothetical protein Ple7327_3601 [Pleurocapsa sp. PCC 7327]
MRQHLTARSCGTGKGTNLNLDTYPQLKVSESLENSITIKKRIT